MTRLTAVLAIVVLATACGDDGGSKADAGAPDAAGGTTFNVPLTAAEEVPVCAGAAAGATGTATVMINAANTMVTVNLTFSGLSGDANNAHIHYGETGVMGGVIFPLGMDPVSPVSKTFTAADYPATPPDGAPADFAGFITDMKAGKSYINVHTPDCAPGEIRGQIN